MFILKNVLLFLAGVCLVIWGFRVNIDRTDKTDRTSDSLATKKENTASEDGQEQKEAVSPSLSVSLSPAEIRPPKKATAPKKRRNGKTALEKKSPEKATGSQ